MSDIVEVEPTIVVEEEDRHQLDWNRLRDSRDDYDEILFYSDREIILEDGEYVLRRTYSQKLVTEKHREDKLI